MARKFDMSRAWNEALAMLSANRETVLIIAGLFFFLPYLGMMLLLPDMAEGLSMAGKPGGGPEAAMDALRSFYARHWWVFLLIGLAQAVGMLALLDLLGPRRPTVGEALKQGTGALLPYIGSQLIAGFGAGLLLIIPLALMAVSPAAGALLLIAAIVGLIYLMTKFALVSPVLMIDRQRNPVAALRRSWQLTRGNSLRLFLFIFLIALAVTVAFIVVSMIAGLIFALFGPEGALIGNGLVAALLNAAWAVLILAALAAVHRQLAGAEPAAPPAPIE